MTGEDTLSQAAAKAARAKQLLENELLVEALSTLESTYTAAWRSTTIDDVSGREKLFLAVNIVGKVRDHLQAIVNNGKLANAELRQIAETAARGKRWHEIP